MLHIKKEAYVTSPMGQYHLQCEGGGLHDSMTIYPQSSRTLQSRTEFQPFLLQKCTSFLSTESDTGEAYRYITLNLYSQVAGALLTTCSHSHVNRLTKRVLQHEYALIQPRMYFTFYVMQHLTVYVFQNRSTIVLYPIQECQSSQVSLNTFSSLSSTQLSQLERSS